MSEPPPEAANTEPGEQPPARHPRENGAEVRGASEQETTPREIHESPESQAPLGLKEGRKPDAVSDKVRAPVWQENEPVDREDEVSHTYAPPSVRTEDGWRIAGASTRGKHHAHRGLWREDAFAFDTAGGWTIIAVSDGAGSVPLSRVGARVACEHALAYLKHHLDNFLLTSETEEGFRESEKPRLDKLLTDAVRAALEAIRHEAGERERQPEDLTATLLVVVVHRAWCEQHLVAAIQVGDGCVALLERDHSVAQLGRADQGDYSGETRFLTTSGIEATFKDRVTDKLKQQLCCVAVMTDGVSEDFYPEEEYIGAMLLGEGLPGMTSRNGRPLEGVLKSVVRQTPDRLGEALLEWLRYEKRGSFDDRTLVLFWDECWDEG